MDDEGRGFDSRHLHQSGLIRSPAEGNPLGDVRVSPRLFVERRLWAVLSIDYRA